MGKSKFAEQFCNYCGKNTRMAVVGEMEGVKNKFWCRCSKCHHLSLIEVESQEQNSGSQKIKGDLKTYNPETIFSVGDRIFHSEWEDTGKVLKKIITSDGNHAILVAFEKLGERRLLENLQHTEIEKEMIPS